jgi:hypothetical protein
MKRSWLYIIGAILVVAAAVAIFVAMDNSNDRSGKSTSASSSSPSSSTNQTFKPKQACNVFSLADAKQVLGDSAKGGATTNNTSSDDLELSTCSYTQDSGSNVPVSASKSASLLVRAPKTGAGITSNQAQFGYLKPADSQHVAGYGDNAYWDPQYGQLNILKHNAWYILSYGPVTPAARTLDQTKQLADILIDKM